jgi:DNA modification methylase
MRSLARVINFLQGDVFDKLKELDDSSIDCVVTSPPYWGLRDYGVPGQLGLEPTYQEHIQNIVELFRAMKPKLKDSATVWLNYGDSYAATVNGTKAKDIKNDDRGFVDKPFSTIQGSIKPKDLVMIPNRIAIALQDDGWWIRSEIIWHKPNPMPESTKDRPTQCHEKIWLITKSKKYYYDADAIREPLASSSLIRLNQDIKNQKGSTRANGGMKSNGNMKAVFSKKNIKGNFSKRGITRTTEGLNLKTQLEKINPLGKNKRNVWNVEEEQYRIISDKNRPEIVEYRDLPEHNKIREYLSLNRKNKNITIDEIEKHFGNQAGHHWFEKNGSYPSKDDWLKLKKLLNFDDTYDKQLTTINIKSGLKQNHPLGRNKRNVWTITTKPCKDAHFATFPKDLIEPCIKAGCPESGVVLDPFGGSGTTGIVAKQFNRTAILIELNPEYIEIAKKRIDKELGMFK